MNAVSLRVAGVIADYAPTKRVNSRGPRRGRATSVGIMIRYPPTAWPIGSVPVEPGLVTINLPTPKALSMVTRIWLSSIKPVPLIASSVRTGTIATQQRRRARSMPWSWPRRLMLAPLAYVTLVVTLHRSCLMPFVLPGWLWTRLEAGFYVSAGRLMARCTRHY